jgi:ABC-type transporter Mla MlaB component
MMLRISKTSESARNVLLLLEGKVTQQWAALLDSVCRAYLRKSKTVELDCAHVDFVDESGLQVLKNLRGNQVTLKSPPGFIVELLKNGGRS